MVKTGPAVALLLLAGISAWWFLAGAGARWHTSPPAVMDATFVGSETCAGCHQPQQQAWQLSDHYRAMEHANAQTVLGDFNNTHFFYFGRKTVFFQQGQQFLVKTENQQGQLETYTVLYTLGFKPLQQYLVRFADGRIQTLPFAWDTRPAGEGGQRWFHLYPDENIKPENPLFWTRSLQNWNHMCADCHTTNFSKNFSDGDNRFNSQWSELANGCESCHGAASAHVALMQSRPDKQDKLLIQSLRDQTGQINQCGVCHARRERLKENPLQETMLQTWQPELLHEGLYFHDGQIRDEVFEAGSFLQSKMYAAGVTCTNCHDPHTSKLKAEGNALCTQCHNPNTYDDPQHHFHPPNSLGAQCTSCHMPERTYMVINKRHDHRFSIPRPDLTDILDAPNTCNSCHNDQKPAWAAKHIDRHIKMTKGQHVLPEHFGVALWQARYQKQAAQASLKKIIAGKAANPLVQATALYQLGAYLSEENLNLVKAQLDNADPLIRLAAVQALNGLPPEQCLPILASYFADESRAVRLAMAPLLAGGNKKILTTAQLSQLERLWAEYRDWLLSNSDRADALVSLAGFYLAQGDLLSAQQTFDKALQRDDTSLPAHLNYADYYRSLGNDEEAEKLLRRALDIYPDSADAHYALGLLLVRQENTRMALKELLRATQLAPQNGHYLYVYGVGLYSSGRGPEALAVLAEAHNRFPANSQIHSALQAYCAEPAMKNAMACTP